MSFLWSVALCSVSSVMTVSQRLMQEMYELGAARGIPPKFLRFKINGIEE